MILTTNQLQTLKAAIAAETDPTFGALRAAGAVGAMAEWYNQASASTAWNKATPARAANEAPSYSTFDSIVAGKRDSWLIFLSLDRDFSKAKVRNWVTDVWGAGSANEIAVLQAGTRAATKGEMVFGGTSRTTSSVTALDLNVDGQLTADNIIAALGA